MSRGKHSEAGTAEGVRRATGKAEACSRSTRCPNLMRRYTVDIAQEFQATLTSGRSADPESKERMIQRA